MRLKIDFTMAIQYLPPSISGSRILTGVNIVVSFLGLGLLLVAVGREAYWVVILLLEAL